MRLNSDEIKLYKDILSGKSGNIEFDALELIRMIDTIEAQQQEIEQLQSQAAVMREAIIELKPSCGSCNPENCTESCGNIKKFEMIDSVLSSDAGQDYHNPADVEALKLAREAMEYLYLGIPFNTKESLEKTDKALAAIKKLLGGDTP